MFRQSGKSWVTQALIMAGAQAMQNAAAAPTPSEPEKLQGRGAEIMILDDPIAAGRAIHQLMEEAESQQKIFLADSLPPLVTEGLIHNFRFREEAIKPCLAPQAYNGDSWRRQGKKRGSRR